MLQFGPFRLDTGNQCLVHNGVTVALPPKPFAVLRYLVENPGRLITHDELLDKLWPETYVQPQVLRTYMLELRKVLGDDATCPRFIQTLPKRGYCFVAPVADCVEAPGKRAAVSTPLATHATPAVPSPAAPMLVGREGELAILIAQLPALRLGERRVVFIAGEAGIGKTALVDAFCRQVESIQAGAIARGQCVQGIGGKEEYYPVMEGLSRLCASPHGEAACRVLSRIAPAWLGGGHEPEAAPPRPSHERTIGDLCAALEELSAESPLILVFEDLDWADDSTLNLVSALARRRAPASLMVVATYRSRKSAAEHSLKPLKHDLLMRRLCIEIRLTPLARKSVAELLRRELQQELVPDGLDAFVYQRSEGNPLFVIATLHHLIALRFLVRCGAGAAAAWEQRAPFQEIESGVPDALAQMIELDIERLSPSEQQMLEAGSLLNVVFPAWAVAAALEKEPAEVEDALDDLARRLYFVERAGEDELPDGSRSAFYIFAHGLYREVLVQRQPEARRARRHIRMADRLGRLFAGRESSVAREMAMHYEAAGDWSRAATALHAAARHAQNRHAHADAAELLERALRLLENVDSANLNTANQSSLAVDLRSELAAARQLLAKNLLLEENLSAKV
jgi:predicted ATPase/DNA-binding winged helix-turn-helix (wHTH) protein